MRLRIPATFYLRLRLRLRNDRKLSLELCGRAVSKAEINLGDPRMPRSGKAQ